MIPGVKRITAIWAMSVTSIFWCHLTRPATSLPRRQGNKHRALPGPDIGLTPSGHYCLPLSLYREWQHVRRHFCPQCLDRKQKNLYSLRLKTPVANSRVRF